MAEKSGRQITVHGSYIEDQHIDAAGASGVVAGIITGNAQITQTHNSFAGTGTKPDDAEKTEEEADAEAKGNPMSFGSGNTAVLMVAGAGKGSEIFKSDLDQMKEFLTNENIGISEEKIFTVLPRPKNKRTAIDLIKREVENIQFELQDSTDGLFIFYYSGHFGSDRKFLLDAKGDDSKDLCFDADLADLLMTVPAKFMLLILDMCHSALADVCAKDGGDDAREQDSAPQEAPEARLFELLDKTLMAKGDDDDDTSDTRPEKVVQWSSSRSTERSYCRQSSFFSKAIIDEITNADSNLSKDVGSGNFASVLQVNRHITPRVEEAAAKWGKQTPVINPKYAKEDYFNDFPCFAKIL